MPWVRIDDNAMQHPKVASLSDGAFRLWVEGLSYCQRYLTDGHISDVAMRVLRAYSPKRRQLLVEHNLWDVSEKGVRVHNYLQWNESREHVMYAREHAKERMAKLRGSSREQLPNKGSTNGERSLYHTTPLHTKRSETERTNARASGADDVALRAGTFVNETYPALYAELRKGARYVSRPALDFQEALELCRVWDDARLEKIARVFLTTDHEFAENGSRTMAQFRALASWCDSRLAERGIA